jgi:hypothetical protein
MTDFDGLVCEIKEDPGRDRLGLKRVPTYTGDYLWLCPRHYEAFVPKIPEVIRY